MYDDYLEAVSLALQREGVRDVRDATEAQLRAAGDLLAEAVRSAGLAFTVDGAQEGLAEGTFAAHQAWSGDILSAPRYVREEGGYPQTVAAELRYWSPDGPTKVVGCDLTAICAKGRNPVLAHAFLDHLLRFDVALDNFTWNGYQVPMDGATPERFADPAFPWHGAVPATLLPTLLTPEAFGQGQWLVGFGPSERVAWLDQWKRVAPASAPS
jgi:spermidine/putrescine transport system substrate-binding protein